MRCVSKLDGKEPLQHDNHSISGPENIKSQVTILRKASLALKLIPKKHLKRKPAAQKDASRPWFITHI